METKALVVRSWDDLVFTNRNREYGAYPIRKSYSKRLMIGFGVTNAALIVLFLLLDYTQGGPVQRIVDPILPGTIKFTDPPVFRPPTPPSHHPQPQTTIRNPDAPVLVVKEPVENLPDVTEPTEPFVSHDGPATGVAPVDGADTGTGVVDLPLVEPPAEKIFVTAEVMPVYDGGLREMMKFIKRKIHFPRSAEIQGISGSVYVSFVVNGDGKVSQVTVLRGISKDCDEEAVRVVSMLPGWIGGKQNGNPVSVRMVLPITFNVDRN